MGILQSRRVLPFFFGLFSNIGSSGAEYRKSAVVGSRYLLVERIMVHLGCLLGLLDGGAKSVNIMQSIGDTYAFDR
jgi:hypothetical protein